MRTDRSIRSSRDFDRLRLHGAAGRRGAIAVSARPSDPSRPTRLGLAVRRGRGGAVARNRVRRRLRAAFHSVAPARGYDIVVRGDERLISKDFQSIVEELNGALAAAGVRR